MDICLFVKFCSNYKPRGVCSMLLMMPLGSDAVCVSVAARHGYCRLNDIAVVRVAERNSEIFYFIAHLYQPLSFHLNFSFSHKHAFFLYKYAMNISVNTINYMFKIFKNGWDPYQKLLSVFFYCCKNGNMFFFAEHERWDTGKTWHLSAKTASLVCSGGFL